MVRATRRAVLLGATATVGGAVFGMATTSGSRSTPLVRAADEDDRPLSVALLASHAEQMEPLLDTVEESLGFEVETTALEYAELYSQLSLVLTQRAPTFDVVSLDDVWVPQFSTFLTPLKQTESYLSQVPEVVSALSSFPGESEPCCVPWFGNAQFFVSRPEWLARLGLESPTDWNETVEFAIKIGNAFGDEELAGFAIESLTPHQVVNSFLPILRGFGSELIDPQTMVPQIDTPEAIAAAEVFQALATLSPVESAATGEPTNTERFESGTVAMMANFWSSGVLASSSAEMEWKSGPIASTAQPAQQSVPRQTMTGAWLAAIPAGSLQAARAREFIDWLTSTRVQISLIGSLLPPANSAAYADDASIDAQPELPHLLELLAGSTPRPRSPYYPQLELLAATELMAMLAGELSAEEALRNANLAMRAFLAREGVLDA